VDETRHLTDETKRYAPYPFPTAHEVILSAVSTSGRVDYEIIDDTTSSIVELSLQEKKDKLFQDVDQETMRLKREIVPQGKERLLTMKANKTFMVIEEERSEEDTTFLNEFNNKKSKLEALDWWNAELHDQIADLTEENIDTWKIPSHKE